MHVIVFLIIVSSAISGCAARSPSPLLSYFVKLGVEIVDDDIVFETEYWKVVLHKNQYYLGRSVLRLKRLASSITELTDAEQSDFFNALRFYETAVKKSFGADMINTSCLMNNGYRMSPPVVFVHCHIRPRYRNPIMFMGYRFEDKEFGSHYKRGGEKINISREACQGIIRAIRKNLPVYSSAR